MTLIVSRFQQLRQAVLPKTSWVVQAAQGLTQRVATDKAALYGPKINTSNNTAQTQSPAERLGLDENQTIPTKQASVSSFSKLPWVKSAAANQRETAPGLNFTALVEQLKIQTPDDGIHDYKQVAANFNNQLRTLINTHNFTKEQKANLELLSRSAILPLLEVACQHLGLQYNKQPQEKTEFINTLIGNILNNESIAAELQSLMVNHSEANGTKSDGLAYFAKNFLKANAKSEIVKTIVSNFSDVNKTTFANNIHYLAEKSGKRRNHFTGGKAFDLTLRYTTHGKALKSAKNFYGKSYTMVAVRLAAIAKTAFVAGVIAEPINFSSLDAAVDGLGTTINSAVDSAHGFFANTLPSGMEQAWSATGDGLSNAAQTVGNGLSNAASAISDGFGDAAAAVGDAFNTAYGADTFAAKSSAVLTGIGGAAALFAGGLLGKNIQKRKLATAIDAYQTEKNASAQQGKETPSTTAEDALVKLLAKYGENINAVNNFINNDNTDMAKILKENFIKKTVGGASKVLTRGTVNTGKAIGKGGLITLGVVGFGAAVTGKAAIKGAFFASDRLAGAVTYIAGNAAYRFASDLGRGTGANAAVKSLKRGDRKGAQIAFAHQALGLVAPAQAGQTNAAPTSVVGAGFLKGIGAGLSKAVAGVSTFATRLRRENVHSSEPRALAEGAEHTRQASSNLGDAPLSNTRNFEIDASQFPEIASATEEELINVLNAELSRRNLLSSQPSLSEAQAPPANTTHLDSDDDGTPLVRRRDGMNPFSATRPASDGQPPLNPLAQPFIPAPQAQPSTSRSNFFTLSQNNYTEANITPAQTEAQSRAESVASSNSSVFEIDFTGSQNVAQPTGEQSEITPTLNQNPNTSIA